MAHVLILREAPSFIQGNNLIYGTHEEVEQNINNRLYEFDGYRKGYNSPHPSEFKLVWYRMKEECIPQFLRDLRVFNLNPKQVKWKHFWLILLPSKWLIRLNERRIRKGKQPLTPRHWLAMGKAKLMIMFILRLVPFLKSADVAEGEIIPFTDKWCYNFFLGYIPDINKGFGEEL